MCDLGHLLCPCCAFGFSSVTNWLVYVVSHMSSLQCCGVKTPCPLNTNLTTPTGFSEDVLWCLSITICSHLSKFCWKLLITTAHSCKTAHRVGQGAKGKMSSCLSSQRTFTKRSPQPVLPQNGHVGMQNIDQRVSSAWSVTQCALRIEITMPHSSSVLHVSSGKAEFAFLCLKHIPDALRTSSMPPNVPLSTPVCSQYCVLRDVGESHSPYYLHSLSPRHLGDVHCRSTC